MAQQRDKVPGDNLLHGETALGLGAGGPMSASEADAVAGTRVNSPTRNAIRRFRRNWAAMISLSLILILIVMAIFAPLMHTANPFGQNFDVLDHGPDWTHWFGTDSTGRDQYSRLVFGLRVPLVVGIVGTVITVMIGTLLGVVAGYFGSIIDSLLSRFTDLMFAFPGFTLSLIVVSLFGNAADSFGLGGGGRVILLTVIFALVSWPPLMRFVRSLALSMKEQQFVEAARTCGGSHWSIMWRHLLPNMWGLILVQGSFIVVAVISNETVLSIFGLTVQAPNPDLGAMLFEGVQRIGTGYWEVLFPGIVLAVLIVAFTFVADGVRDAVDPRGR